MTNAPGVLVVVGRGVMGDGGTRTAGVEAGVGGPEEAGEGISTTHMLEARGVSWVLAEW